MKRLWIPALAVTACLFSGCAFGDSVWEPALTGADEAEPARSLKDLVERAEVVLAGEISGVSREFSSVIIDVLVTEVILGSGIAERVHIEVPPLDSLRDFVEENPHGQAMWFLTPAGAPGRYAIASNAGVIAQEEGSLRTIADRTLSDQVLPEGVKSMHGLAEAVQKIS
ncbi:MAG: hypothetical protein LBU38_04950 [Propionibacteriaceae bacterium]|nr:hypothetical protein [Propionibacteriaceae bacterium]